MRTLQLCFFVVWVLALSACDETSLSTAQNERLRDNVRVVGSSTVFPFAARTAQEFRNKTGSAVVVEATGSGGGHKLFCSGDSLRTPDIVTSSRRQKPSEADACAAISSRPVFEIELGLDGIVLGQLTGQPSFDVSLKAVYLALAETTPQSDTDCTPVQNPHTNWNSVSSDLPARPITVYGPPPTSGTRDSFVELVMQAGARQIPCLADLETMDAEAFRARAEVLREDGRWVDSGENDNAIIQTLLTQPDAVGIFGYSFLNKNRARISALSINGILPDTVSIQSRAYPVSRPLFIYVKTDHLTSVPALGPYILELLSDDAISEQGYLSQLGLVPISSEQAGETRKAFIALYSGSGFEK